MSAGREAIKYYSSLDFFQQGKQLKEAAQGQNKNKNNNKQGNPPGAASVYGIINLEEMLTYAYSHSFSSFKEKYA